MKSHPTTARSTGPGQNFLSTWLLLVTGAIAAPACFAQPMTPSRALQEATGTAKRIEAVTGNTPNSKAPPGDPCALLSIAEAKKVFPSVAAPERSRRIESYGISECIWKGSNGQILLVVQESSAESVRQARDEVLGMSDGFIDPLKPGARKNVRVEKFAAPGIDNAAFVENADQARGILSDGSYMALVRGRQVVTLMSPELPSRSRSDALKALENLGTSVAKSMK